MAARHADPNKTYTTMASALRAPEAVRRLELTRHVRSTDDLAGLGRLRSLEGLYLEFARPTALPDELGELEHLKQVTLVGRLTELPIDVLSRLPLLQSLAVSGTGLSALPPAIARLRALERLHVAQHKIRALPPEIAAMPRLRSLELSGTGLTSLPAELADMPGLEALAMMNSPGVRLENAALAPALRSLDLFGSRLTRLPDELAALGRTLETLHLWANPLDGFPAVVASLTRLTTLKLCGASLGASGVPPSIDRLGSLEELSLVSCGLGALPTISDGSDGSVTWTSRATSSSPCRCRSGGSVAWRISD
jgi:Leucine-rich repeat (LRR) protein